MSKCRREAFGTCLFVVLSFCDVLYGEWDVMPSDIVHYRTDLAFIKKALKVIPKSRALCPKKKGKGMCICIRIYTYVKERGYINDGQYIYMYVYVYP